MNSKFHIYTDFDGTISIGDVGDKVFEKFTDSTWRQVLQEWYNGKIGSKEYYDRCSKTMQMTEQQLNDFCETQEIDKHFIDFESYCQTKNIPVTVLSDGMDNYIKRILFNNGLQHLKVYANRFIFLNENKVETLFPYYERGCLKCANCKGAHIKEHRKDGEIIVYIGDGLSDLCAVSESDIIFATSVLKQHCQENNIQHHAFNNFEDIFENFKQIVNNYKKGK